MLKDSESAISDETGLSLETKKERERRRSLGIYYTPPEAAIILARWAIRNHKETVLEPSFGGCAMLSAAVSVFKSLGNDSPSKQLYGYDVDPAAFGHLAQMGINNAEGNFKEQNFLCTTAGDLRVDAVIANPPFVSHHRQDERQRRQTEKLRQLYMPKLPRLASLWAFFLLHSMSFLRPGGRMAFLLPNAIGNADYARPLLAFLQTRFEKVELVHVSERLFIQAGADERISLLLLSEYTPEGLSSPARLISREILSIGELTNEAPGTETRNILEPENIRELATATLTKLGAGVLVELSSKASVHIGEVVGDIGFFVRPLSVWKQLEIGTKYLSPLLTRAAQIDGVYVGKKNQAGPSLIPGLLLPPVQRQPKAISNYLSLYPEENIAENRTFEKRDIWYRCSYETNADAFIGSMSHEFPRIIGNDAGISCSNAFYKIVVQDCPDLAAWLPILGVTTPLRLSAEILGRVRGSGGIKLEPSDVKKLLIPTVLPKLSQSEFKTISEQISKLVGVGELDAAGQLADSIVFLRTNLISSKTMTSFRTLRLSLTGRRLAKSA